MRAGQVVQGGTLAGIGASIAQTAHQAVRGVAVNAIAQGMEFGAFKKQLTGLIKGSGGGLGIIESHLYTAVYDTFQQYDREVQRQYSQELGLEYAIYSGDIRETSREWCERWAGEVLTTEEIESWRDKTWAGKNTDGYDPFVDCGGYNCTHIWNYISREAAIALRPDLNDEK